MILSLLCYIISIAIWHLETCLATYTLGLLITLSWILRPAFYLASQKYILRYCLFNFRGSSWRKQSDGWRGCFRWVRIPQNAVRNIKGRKPWWVYFCSQANKCRRVNNCFCMMQLSEIDCWLWYVFCNATAWFLIQQWIWNHQCFPFEDFSWFRASAASPWSMLHCSANLKRVWLKQILVGRQSQSFSD